MIERPRRLRKTSILRNLVAQTRLSLDCLVQPYFIAEGAHTTEPIEGFAGVNRLGVEPLSRRIEGDLERGLRSFLLFGGTPEALKDESGSHAFGEDSTVGQALRVLRTRFGDSANLLTDVCLCPYTSHGHCGVSEEDNDRSVEELAKLSLLHAQWGADIVAPSDMMDGRVGAIRKRLDENGFESTGIMAYTAKYASNYYGPFRSALGSAPKKMTRASYQMDFRNSTEATRETRLDIAEGADIVMVKPALAYLDVIQKVKAVSDVPVAAYSVSGEYQMVKLLSQNGMCDERSMALENLTAIRRAGADIIITYFASDGAERRWFVGD